MVKKIGVYMILNTQTNECYIGSSIDIDRRVDAHFFDLRKGNHDNKRFQKSYDLHEEDDFIISHLELFDEINQEDLKDIETFYIQHYKDESFNIIHYGSMSDYNKNKTVSDETRSKLKNSMLEFYEKNPQAKENLRNKNLGKKYSYETRQKVSQSSKDNWLNPEYRETVITKLKGRKHSAESIAKMSAAHKGKKFSEESRKKMSLASAVRNVGRKHSEETKAKMRAKALARKRDAKGTFIGGKNE